MSNSFAEVRFDAGIIPRGSGGITFKTTIIKSGGDFERRNIARTEYLFEGDIGEVLLDKKQVAYTTAFFAARRGKVEGFRYKYWGDYQCTHQSLQLGPNTTSQGVATLTAPGEYQLQKKYTDAGDITYKTILKPVQGTIEIYVNGTQQSSGVAVDYVTGRISFSTAPASSSVIAWSGEFDLPVWFDTDSLPGVHIYNNDSRVPFYPDKELVYKFDSLPIVELPVGEVSPFFTPLPVIPPPVAAGQVKAIYRVESGGQFNFYVAGDRAVPTQVYSIPGSATSINAWISNQGNSQSEWVAGIKYQVSASPNTWKIVTVYPNSSQNWSLEEGDSVIDPFFSAPVHLLNRIELIYWRGNGYWTSDFWNFHSTSGSTEDHQLSTWRALNGVLTQYSGPRATNTIGDTNTYYVDSYVSPNRQRRFEAYRTPGENLTGVFPSKYRGESSAANISKDLLTTESYYSDYISGSTTIFMFTQADEEYTQISLTAQASTLTFDGLVMSHYVPRFETNLNNYLTTSALTVNIDRLQHTNHSTTESVDVIQDQLQPLLLPSSEPWFVHGLSYWPPITTPPAAN